MASQNAAPETTASAINEQLSRDNVDLHRRVVELEAQDRERLRRISALKLAIAEAQRVLAEVGTPDQGGVQAVVVSD